MNSPLGNTIRSFWTPEHTSDPDKLAPIRADKIAFLAMLAALILAGTGVVACTIGLLSVV